MLATGQAPTSPVRIPTRPKCTFLPKCPDFHLASEPKITQNVRIFDLGSPPTFPGPEVSRPDRVEGLAAALLIPSPLFPSHQNRIGFGRHDASSPFIRETEKVATNPRSPWPPSVYCLQMRSWIAQNVRPRFTRDKSSKQKNTRSDIPTISATMK